MFNIKMMTPVNYTTMSFHSNHPVYTGVCITFAVLVICVSVVGNFLVIATFLKTERLRTPTYYLLSSLAATDFLNGLIGVPLELYRRVVFSDITCLEMYSRYFSAFSYLFGGNNLFHIIMVTCDRYIAVHRPLRYQTLVTTKRIAIGILISWLMSIVGFMLHLVSKLEESPTTATVYCSGTTFQYDLGSRIWFFLVMTAIIASVSTLLVLNLLILRTAMRHARRIADMEQAIGRAQDDITASRVKASKKVTFITLAFFLTCIPMSVFHIIVVFDTEAHLYSRPFDDVTMFMFFCGSAVNPIIYCYHNRTFRENTLKYFKTKAVWRKLCSTESTFS
ncbi:trace amine-associated receptor 7d-like [Lytechinus variegatus]|uniref:trace amine-associated receptor 7d-like n=1 Tax=Lytechinus variegatus TaxID=7654 RepID=UPI001BB106D5|nr:trace amine-associated receptor 7d-like [Lytechinus variegatus]